MASVLKITDGTTTVDFLHSSGTYRTTEWIPAVATRRVGEIGDVGPYDDVVEEMVISVRGNNPAAELRVIQKLFDQATRWGTGDPVPAVTIQYTPTGSSINVAAVITGPAAPGEPMIELPHGATLSPTTKNIDGARLRFKRRGVWVRYPVLSTGTTNSGTSDIVLTLNLGATPAAESPYTLEMDSVVNYADIGDSYILISEENGLNRVRAETLTTTGFTSVADGSNLAENTNVLRYTPTGTVMASSSATDAIVTGDRFAIFVNYRNNGAPSYRIRAYGHRIQFGYDPAMTTQWYTIPGGASTPRWVMIGEISVPDGYSSPSIYNFYVGLQIIASATGSTIDFDSIAVLRLDSPASAAIAISPAPFSYAPGGTKNAVIDHRLLTHPSPQMYFSVEDPPGLERRYSYGTAGRVGLSTATNPLHMMWLATGGGNVNHWRRSSGGSPVSRTFTGRLSAGYLIPE